jgi:hypothetical protein
MRRVLLVAALAAVVSGLAGCASGFPGRVSDVTDTGATLHGVVGSTREQATYWFRYGETVSYGQRTPVRDIDFIDRPARHVSEPIAGLSAGKAYHYSLCAEDSENSGAALCSPDQIFGIPIGSATLTLTPSCEDAPFGIAMTGSGFPPNQPIALIRTDNALRTAADANGDLDRAFFGSVSPLGFVQVFAYEINDDDLTVDPGEDLLAVAEIDKPCE